MRTKLELAVRRAREAYKAGILFCQVCNKRPPVDLHEIARGVHRRRGVKERCTWLCVCRRCHDELGDYSIWPITRQLAVKMLSDPAFFDLKKFNELRDRSPEAITLGDVTKHLQLIERKR